VSNYIIDGKGQTMTACICSHNIDLSSGCPTGTPDGKTFERKNNNRCDYCYALRYNYTEYKPKQINWTSLEKEIVEQGVKVLRTGKSGDPGYKDDRENLYNLLEICKKHNTRAILITKLLEPGDMKLAQLLIDTNSSLHFSLGDDTLEKGAVLLGFNNKTRLLYAKQYHALGVNVQLRVVTDPTRDLKEIDQMAIDSGIKVLLTPMRYYSKAQAEADNSDWEDLKSTNRYKHTKGSLHPNVDLFKSIWKDTKKVAYCGIGIDSQGNEKTGCNFCNIHADKNPVEFVYGFNGGLG
jgi:hypothetical protein